MFAIRGQPRRKVEHMKNLHHYRVELFYTMIDIQLQKLNTHFAKASTEPLLCMTCLDLSNSFSAFDKHKLICFAQFYPPDFSSLELIVLENQAKTYVIDMHSCDEFVELQGIGDLGI